MLLNLVRAGFVSVGCHISFMHVFTALNCILEGLILVAVRKVSSSKMQRNVINVYVTRLKFTYLFLFLRGSGWLKVLNCNAQFFGRLNNQLGRQVRLHVEEVRVLVGHEEHGGDGRFGGELLQFVGCRLADEETHCQITQCPQSLKKIQEIRLQYRPEYNFSNELVLNTLTVHLSCD